MDRIPGFATACDQLILTQAIYTNVFLIRNGQVVFTSASAVPRILLGYKKRGFGKGKWNGFGGKVQAGETIEAAALREVKEEAGIEIKRMERIGLLEFVFSGRTQALVTHLFLATEYLGSVTESDEMLPDWFPSSTDAIPFESMWSDDRFWFPYLLRGQKFVGKFYLD
ncbi:Nudix (Nucleoside diphosphate linked moiety X)-type motif 1, partial [Massospora cicadina]